MCLDSGHWDVGGYRPTSEGQVSQLLGRGLLIPPRGRQPVQMSEGFHCFLSSSTLRIGLVLARYGFKPRLGEKNTEGRMVG